MKYGVEMFDSRAGKIIAVVSTIALFLLTLSLALDSVWLSLAFFVTTAPYMLLIVHDINCTFLGSCSVWGWVKTVMQVLSMIVLIVLGFIMIFSKNTISTTVSSVN